MSKEEIEQRVSAKVSEIAAELEFKRRQADKRDVRFGLVFGGMLAMMSVVSVIHHDWLDLIYCLSTIIWILLVTLQSKLINGKSYIIGMYQGLQDIQMAELESIGDSLTPNKKGATSVSTNA